MFIMANDGGLSDDKASQFTTKRILCQRIFFFNVLSRGISVTLLKGAEYRDSKVRYLDINRDISHHIVMPRYCHLCMNSIDLSHQEVYFQ